MNHCSSCGRGIPESATVCEQCEWWAAKSVAPLVREAMPEHDAASSAPTASAPSAFSAPAGSGSAKFAPTPAAVPATGGGMDRRVLMLVVLAVGVGAVITLTLMLARGGSPAEVSAAPATAGPRSPVAGTHEASIAGTLPPSNAGQHWTSDNRGYWVGNRKNSPAFELPAENTVPVWMNQVRPTLVVRCISKQPEVFVVTESALKIEAQTEDHTVTFRFDEEPEFTDRWPDSAEHDALFAPDGSAFAQRLSRARTLRVGYTPHNAAPVVVNFQVSGLGALLQPVEKECGWKK